MSVILVGLDGRCFCDCATKCVLHRVGSSLRCTKEELEAEGYKTLQVADEKSNRAVQNAMTAGLPHKLKVRNKK